MTAFGDDFRTTYEVLLVGPVEATWKQEVLPLLAREAQALPHDAGVWRALATMLGGRFDVLSAAQEIERRLVAQTTF